MYRPPPTADSTNHQPPSTSSSLPVAPFQSQAQSNPIPSSSPTANPLHQHTQHHRRRRRRPSATSTASSRTTATTTTTTTTTTDSRPTTSAGPPSSYLPPDHARRPYTFSNAYDDIDERDEDQYDDDDDEYDESEAEDVFAFGPPSTADQLHAAAAAALGPLHDPYILHHHMQMPIGALPAPVSVAKIMTPAPTAASASVPSTTSSAGAAFAFSPHADPGPIPAIPSTLSPLVSPALTSPLLAHAKDPAQAAIAAQAGPSLALAPRHPFAYPMTPVTTPSTPTTLTTDSGTGAGSGYDYDGDYEYGFGESRAGTGTGYEQEGEYRMGRIRGGTGTGRLSALSSAVSSREVRVSLPKDRAPGGARAGRRAYAKGKGRTPEAERERESASASGSASIPSVSGLDSQEGSIK